ncbi:MAG: Type 1 glutamine amidotransferase-like domain-containing protein [Clostridia bacterium]|nr:Type 1 glutamine amidotransferase-like domain-containing protein [Clostridia bacterium]
MNKILFLTSSPFTEPGGPLNDSYGFVDRLKKAIRQNRNALFITASPDDIDGTKQFAEGFRWTAKFSDIEFDSYRILDRQTQNCAEELINKSNFLILGGGHVPTQAAFFEEIKLKSLLERFEGVILGISAGSMNAASVVYAQPELEGEATDPAYKRFFSGLGLTDYNLLPHYNFTKNVILDGKKLFEEITYPDSMEREFYAICDGSYLYSENGYEQIFGEAYRIHNGTIEKL